MDDRERLEEIGSRLYINIEDREWLFDTLKKYMDRCRELENSMKSLNDAVKRMNENSYLGGE